MTRPNGPLEIITSEVDENLMMNNVGKCYGSKKLALRISVEHYRYLVEQIVSLRQYGVRSLPDDVVLRRAAQIQQAKRTTRKGWPKGKKRETEGK